MSKFVLFFIVALVILCLVTSAAKKAKEADPKECEVCVANLEAIDKLIPAEKKKR